MKWLVIIVALVIAFVTKRLSDNVFKSFSEKLENDMKEISRCSTPVYVDLVEKDGIRN